MTIVFQDGVTPLNATNLNKLEQTANKGVANGYAGLDATGKVPAGQLPASAPSIPAGVIAPYIAAAAPAGWLLCDGSAVSRATYAALYALIGNAYGAGDGSTTFNLPDFQGRMPVGLGTHADVNALAKNEGSAAANRRPKHPHTNGLALSGAPGVGTLALPNHAHAVNDPPHTHQVMDSDNVGGDIGIPGVSRSSSHNSGSSTWATLAAATGVTVGNPTSLPAISGAPAVGTLAVGGTIGAAGVAADAPAYLVVNFIIKT